jgi:hypothetical protein
MRRLLTLLTTTVLFCAWSAPTAASEEAAPTDEAGFVALVEAALEKQDRDAIAELSYWEGVDEEQRKLQEKRQEPIFETPAAKIELRPVPAGYRAEYVSRGIVYRVNLPVEGLLRIQFEGEFETHESRLFPYGKHDGRYYIARVAKVGTSSPEEKEKQLFIGVMVPSGTEAADYVVSCSYNAGGEEMREKYEGNRSTQKVLWGRKINWCRLWNRSEETSVRLVLKENLETFYESAQIGPGRSAVYP